MQHCHHRDTSTASGMFSARRIKLCFEPLPGTGLYNPAKDDITLGTGLGTRAYGHQSLIKVRTGLIFRRSLGSWIP